MKIKNRFYSYFSNPYMMKSFIDTFPTEKKCKAIIFKEEIESN